MKPHPRIRKTIKWGGAAGTVLLVVVWIGSGKLMWSWHPGRDLRFSVACGTLTGLRFAEYLDDQDIANLRGQYERIRVMDHWKFAWSLEAVGPHRFLAWRVNVPLWLPTLCAAMIALTGWRLDTLARRRAKGGLNLCPKCGYDRTGLASKDAKCPECGAAPAGV